MSNTVIKVTKLFVSPSLFYGCLVVTGDVYKPWMTDMGSL